MNDIQKFKRHYQNAMDKKDKWNNFIRKEIQFHLYYFYGLNVCVPPCPPNSYSSNVMVFEGGASGRWSNQEAEALLNGTSAL